MKMIKSQIFSVKN